VLFISIISPNVSNSYFAQKKVLMANAKGDDFEQLAIPLKRLRKSRGTSKRDLRRWKRGHIFRD
jgi:hypothetical protein